MGRYKGNLVLGFTLAIKLIVYLSNCILSFLLCLKIYFLYAFID